LQGDGSAYQRREKLLDWRENALRKMSSGKKLVFFCKSSGNE